MLYKDDRSWIHGYWLDGRWTVVGTSLSSFRYYTYRTATPLGHDYDDEPISLKRRFRDLNPQSSETPRYSQLPWEPKTHEKWRFYTPKIWVITTKTWRLWVPMVATNLSYPSRDSTKWSGSVCRGAVHTSLVSTPEVERRKLAPEKGVASFLLGFRNFSGVNSLLNFGGGSSYQPMPPYYIYLEPKWPLFCLEKALFWGVDLQK